MLHFSTVKRPVGNNGKLRQKMQVNTIETVTKNNKKLDRCKFYTKLFATKAAVQTHKTDTRSTENSRLNDKHETELFIYLSSLV